MERGGGKIKRGADRHYLLMPTKDIIAMEPFITDLMDENSHIYMWVTNNFLEDGLKVMREWGYTYITKITWIKEGKIGLGQYYRGMSEDCLFGRKGKVPYKVIDGKRQQGVTAFSAPRGKHSEKPDFMRQQIEKVSFGPFVEIFARPQENDDIFADTTRPEWHYIGNQADGTVF
jgi:N6-adenosine-specific RNA methylase IME4